MCLLPLLTLCEPVHALSIQDDSGHEVRLERPAERVVSLYGAFTEWLAAMDRLDLLVSRTANEHEPKRVAALPAIGTHLRPNLERILALRPDLVLQMSGRDAAMEPVRFLREHGIPTAVFSVHDFPGLFSALKRVGTLCDAELEAGNLVGSMKERLAEVASRIRERRRPSVFFEVRWPNLLGAGKHSMVDAVIRAAGGRNALEQGKKLVRLGQEALLDLNPDVYVVQKGPMNPDPVPPAERPQFTVLGAVRSGKVLTVDERRFSRPGPRGVGAVEKLASFLHPDAFAGENAP